MTISSIVECGWRHFDVFLIFGGAIAGECGGLVGKLDYDVARTAIAFRNVEFAAAY